VTAGPHDERPLLAALTVAREHGVAVERAEVVNEGSNLVVRLLPAPLIVRVATGTAEMRPGGEGIARELAVAGALAQAGARVVAPSALLPPGPHVRDGFTLGFWERAAPAGRPLDAYAAGRRLRECHAALAQPAVVARLAGDERAGGARAGGGTAGDERARLRRWGALEEAAAIVERLAVAGDLGAADAALLRERGAVVRERVQRLALPLQPIHGDAHLRNVLDDAARGPLWNDWEDAFLGPRGWDLACLYAALPPFGDHDPAAAGQAYRGYGEPLHADALRALVASRRWQLLVWGAALARRAPARRPWFEQRIAHLRASRA
jgi:Ser/Thr protein kinase RdoA (MazF antagonist)